MTHPHNQRLDDPHDIEHGGFQLPKDNIHQFDSGAVRSSDADHTRFDLICPTGLDRLARICAEGEKKYGAGNWQKGMPIQNTLNHLERHISLWKCGNRDEDHLAKAVWGLVAIIHFESLCHCGENIIEMGMIDKAYLHRNDLMQAQTGGDNKTYPERRGANPPFAGFGRRITDHSPQGSNCDVPDLSYRAR